MRARDGWCGFGAPDPSCARVRLFFGEVVRESDIGCTFYVSTFLPFIEPDMKAEIACGCSWCLAR